MVLAIFLGIPPAPRNLGLGSGQQPSGEVRAAYAQLHRALADLGALARLQRQTECRLEQPYHEAALHLALAADMRMGGRGERLVRVGQFAACLGTAIGLKQDTVALLCRAAALQNVGFAAQAAPHPAARLAPPRTQGRCHTLLGAEVLAGCDHPLFALGQTIALAHHERWDGQGYPLGLCGRHIPLAAQIAAMADTPESALRPPFPAIGRERLAEQLTADAGHFDPGLSRLCSLAAEELLALGERISRRFADPGAAPANGADFDLPS